MKIIEIKDQIVRIKLDKPINLFQGEILLIEDTIPCYLLSATTEEVYAILFSNEAKIYLGNSCSRTFQSFSVNIPNNLFGSIWNYQMEKQELNAKIKINNKLPITTLKANRNDLINQTIEPPITYIDSRRGISKPLETGIFIVDTTIPIGRGQRELIIGDRQTGKTSIAIDTILNQKNKNMICIYVAIGKKKQEIFDIYLKLNERNALNYTIIFSALAGDGPIQQFLIPYVATLVAEKFREKGLDVLVVYDDLSKHAKAYRSFSLLTGISPGREAYPGDIFYIHARLLERAGSFNAKLGNGSITAMPIIETQLDIVTNYIETNLISITDGQIVTLTKLRNQDFMPAIDIGNSVSRVGSHARLAIMNDEVKGFKALYVQYLDLKKFVNSESALPLSKKQIFIRGTILEAMFSQKNENPYHYSIIWVLSLLLNAGVLDFFEGEDVQVLKENLLLFASENQFARNFLKLVYQAQNYQKLSKNVDANDAREVIVYYAMQTFVPIIKKIGKDIYHANADKVNEIDLLLVDFQESLYEVKNIKNKQNELSEMIQKKILALSKEKYE